LETNKLLQSLEAEYSRLIEANNWKDLPKSIRYAVQKRIDDINWQLERLKKKA
jgi:hypothetical protein